MIAINVEPNQRQSVAPVMAAMGIRFVPAESDWKWAEKNFGVQATPTALLLDQRGRIMFRPTVHDAATRELLEREIDALLNRK